MVEFVGASEAAAAEVIETVDASEGNVGEAVRQVAAEIAWACHVAESGPAVID